MKKPDAPEPTVRKTIALPQSMWGDVAEYRFSRRISKEAEAVRRLIQAGLDVMKRKERG